jgi:hypothetical protein
VAAGMLVPVGHRPADERRGDRDERLDDHRSGKCPAPPPPEAAARAVDRAASRALRAADLGIDLTEGRLPFPPATPAALNRRVQQAAQHLSESQPRPTSRPQITVGFDRRRGLGCADVSAPEGSKAGCPSPGPPGSDGTDIACYLAAFAISSCIFARSLYSLAADS